MPKKNIKGNLGFKNLTNIGKDEIFSQEISKLNQYNARKIKYRYKECDKWLNKCFANQIFFNFDAKTAQLNYFLIRRTHSALITHDLACINLKNYINSTKRRNPNYTMYFRSLDYFECSISMASQAYSRIRKHISSDLYDKNETNSPYYKLDKTYNNIRYNSIPENKNDYLHSAWLKNEGISSYIKERNKEPMLIILEYETLSFLIRELSFNVRKALLI